MLDDAEPFKQKTNGQAGEARLSTDGADIEATLEELAALSPIAYDRRRKEAATRLSIRESTLDSEVYRRRPRSADDAPGAALLTARTAENVTVKEVLDEYFEDKISANGGYESAVDKSERAMVEKSFGAFFVSDLKREDVLGWIEDRIATRGVDRHSAERPMKAFRAAINYARASERRDGSEKVPLEIAFQFPRLKAGSSVKERYLTVDEISALLLAVSQLRRHADEVSLWTRLAIATGGRAVAILELTWSRIDLENRLLDLRNPNLKRRQKNRALVRIPDALIGVLAAAWEKSTSDAVFSISYEVLMVHFRKAAKAAGLWSSLKAENVTPHVLRHTTATQLAKSGAPIESISAILGHADIKITRAVYAKYSPSFFEKESVVLGDLLTPKLKAVGDGE